MIDDYSYSPRELPPKNSESFGLGGRPNEGSRGLGGTLIDSGSVGGGGVSGGGGDGVGITGPRGEPGQDGTDGQNGTNGVNGETGATGATGFIGIEPTINGVVVSNGNTNEFEILGNSSNSILSTNNSNELYWQQFPNGNNNGDMLVWSAGQWTLLPPPSGSGTHVLSSTGGIPTWLGTESCDTPP
jgi:hypothetical protein